MTIKIPVACREAAVAKGFSMEDVAAWVDVLGSWAYDVGAAEVSFGTGPGDSDLCLHLTFFDKNPDDVLLGDVCMRERIGSKDNPIRLENFDPYTLRPVLQGYRRMQRLFLKERQDATALLRESAEKMDALVSQRPYYRIDRLADIAEWLRFPSPRANSEKGSGS